jgi:hypothetical protein
MKQMKNFCLFLILSFPLMEGCSLATVEQQSSSWELDSPAPEGSRQHGLSVTSNDKLLLSWVEGIEPENRVRFSVLEDKGWSKPQTIVRTTTKLAASPQVRSFQNGSLAAAWMVSKKQTDFRFAAEMYLARSDDGGQHWSAPVIPYSEQARLYNAQMSLSTLKNDELALVWTDTRNLKSNNRYQLMAGIVDQNGKINTEWILDDDVCSCCTTDIAVKGKDWLVAYRDHLPGEVRDISLARLRNGNVTKKIIYNDDWVISGCPSNGPNVSWLGSQVMVTWFTAVGGVGRVKVVFSEDNGKTFGPIVELDNNANGYVSAFLYEQGFGVIAWRGRSGAEEELRVARVSPDGKIQNKIAIFRGDFPRWPSKYPSLVRAGEEAFVAWTVLGPRVRLAKLPVAMMAN